MSEKFWDKTAKKYSKSPIKNMEAYNQTLDRVREHLKATDNVLELGCGTGSTALILAEHVDHITASDISGNMVDIGREKAAESGIVNISFARSSVPGEVLDTGPFDAVLGFNLLHLVEDMPGAVQGIHKALKPGGLFISKTPCISEKSFIFPILLPVMRFFGFAPFVRCWKVAPFEAVIEGAGFEIIERGDYPPTMPSRFLVARKV